MAASRKCRLFFSSLVLIHELALPRVAIFFEVPVVPMHETAAKKLFYLYEKVYKPAIGGPKNIGKAIIVNALPRA